MYSKYIVRSVAQFQINWVIKLLILSDFLIFSAQQFFVPIFAIFVTEHIQEGSLEVVALTTSIYFVVRSLVEVPVGMWIDRTKSETDDLFSAFCGVLLMSIVYFSYNFVSEVWQLYSLQVLLGVGAAFAFPGWYSIFTKHIDKNKEALEWSLYDVVLGIGMAAAAAIGGVIVTQFGFDTIFHVAGVTTLLGALLLLSLKNKICKRERYC